MKERMAWLEQNTVLTFGRCRLGRRVDLLELDWWRRLAYERAGCACVKSWTSIARHPVFVLRGSKRCRIALSVRAVHAPHVHFRSRDGLFPVKRHQPGRHNRSRFSKLLRHIMDMLSDRMQLYHAVISLVIALGSGHPKAPVPVLALLCSHFTYTSQRLFTCNLRQYSVRGSGCGQCTRSVLQAPLFLNKQLGIAWV